ncbi:MAG: hypothetical protein IKU58_00250 [Clostridia bacterium]|nr:hypothetical protein [Clostridia bacterium]
MSKIRDLENCEILPGRIVTGSVFGITGTLALTLLAALALHGELLKLEACRWLGPMILAVSALLCAWFAALKNRKKLMCGLLSVMLYGSVLMIGGMLLFSAPMQAGRLALSVGAMLVGGLAGAILSGVTD